MPLLDTPTSYGALTRTLHWLTALVVLTAFPLGLLANNAPSSTDTEIARAFALFSAHKTLGVTALALGLIRLALRLTQPRPGPLHPNRRLETFLAAVAHWTLTVGLITVPLTGWLSHSATPGLAPILLPVPQSLPGIQTSAGSADLFGAIHWLATKVLGLAILLHIAGALKHGILDRDATLARMTRGTPAGHPHAETVRPLLAALLLWSLTLTTGTLLGQVASERATDTMRDWTVTRSWAVILDARGVEIARTDAVSATLTLTARPGVISGLFDASLIVDTLPPDTADRLLDQNPFPLILVTGTIDGGTATGQIDWGGMLSDIRPGVETGSGTIRLTGQATLPQSDLSLVLDITAQDINSSP